MEKMAKENRKGKGGSGPFNPEIALIAILAILAFAASYYYFSSQLREHDVRGLKVLSKGDPLTEMKSILAGGRVVIKSFAYPGPDERNSYIALMTGEIAGAFSASGRNSSVFALVPEATNESERQIGCSEETNFCSGERVEIRIDACNCIKIEGGKIYILYEQEKLKQTPLRTQIRGIIGGVLKSS